MEKAGKESKTVLPPSIRYPTKRQNYITVTYMPQALDQFHAGSLVVSSVSVSSYMLSLVDS